MNSKILRPAVNARSLELYLPSIHIKSQTIIEIIIHLIKRLFTKLYTKLQNCRILNLFRSYQSHNMI